MSTTDLIRKAIIRKELTDSERLALTRPLLAHPQSAAICNSALPTAVAC